MPRKPSRTFTDKELEILRILWERGEASVKEIQEQLPAGTHYNNVLTIVRVLQRKGHVAYREHGRSHVYRAVVSPEESRGSILSYVIDNVFGGSSTSMVLNLVESGNLSVEDLDEIRRQMKKRVSEEQ